MTEAYGGGDRLRRIIHYELYSLHAAATPRELQGGAAGLTIRAGAFRLAYALGLCAAELRELDDGPEERALVRLESIYGGISITGSKMSELRLDTGAAIERIELALTGGADCALLVTADTALRLFDPDVAVVDYGISGYIVERDGSRRAAGLDGSQSLQRWISRELMEPYDAVELRSGTALRLRLIKKRTDAVMEKLRGEMDRIYAESEDFSQVGRLI